MCNKKCNNMCNEKCNGENMRENTYIKIEKLYKKYRGYVGTKDLLAEGFSNRQISILVEEGYLQKICYGHYWLAGKQCRKPFDYKCIEVSLSLSLIHI